MCARNIIKLAAAGVLLLGASGTIGGLYAADQTGIGGLAASRSAAHQTIAVAGSQASQVASADIFTGNVRIDPLFSPRDGAEFSGAYVTFEPRARSAWHTHPAGQRLVVVSGVGYTQEWGGKKSVIRAGDVVWCPPNVKHWHGASDQSAMTHLAITGSLDGKNVQWLEKVSDKQYGGD